MLQMLFARKYGPKFEVEVFHRCDTPLQQERETKMEKMTENEMHNIIERARFNVAWWEKEFTKSKPSTLPVEYRLSKALMQLHEEVKELKSCSPGGVRS